MYMQAIKGKGKKTLNVTSNNWILMCELEATSVCSLLRNELRCKVAQVFPETVSEINSIISTSGNVWNLFLICLQIRIHFCFLRLSPRIDGGGAGRFLEESGSFFKGEKWS